MSLYGGLAKTTAGLVAKFGGPAVLRRLAVGAYDTNSGVAAAPPTDVPVTAAVLDFSAGQTYQRGNLIQGGDKRVLLDSSEVPNLHDRFVANGVEYTIVSIGEVNPAGTSVLFDLHIRT